MSSGSTTPADLFTQKTDTELLYFLENPDLYHADVVAAAQQELHRREVATRSHLTEAEEFATDDYDNEPAERRWLVPAIGAALLAVGCVLYSQFHKPSPALGVVPKAPTELQSVELNVLPTFEVETAAQVKTEPSLLPAKERTDKKPLGKYLILAGRFWKAEKQAEFLADQVAIAKIDSTFPGKASLVYDQWRELTRVLVYNHNLRPMMQERVNMMHDIANRRMQSLQIMRENYSLGRPPMNSEVLKTLAPVEDMLYELRGGKQPTRHIDLTMAR
ncbi:hypothetical protein H8B13_07885 [Hymenobacter sp. BT188]|uniref:hypothetical protein n=1 Tax=Hymenobacter sp. BT188 TaxID=2763504 RepID=UPI00165162F0|nr:hypothetical protein [Hymenobacter sp. BT188]MBC6606734.1 hypothetical protein [Hymenobacter sp. BT188]